MDLLIISNYWHFEYEKSSSRYLSIANMAAEAGMEVEVVTSSFYHAAKKQRDACASVYSGYKYKATLINEPGYRKNIDPRRILSHRKFAANVLKYLQKRKRPDTIYLFVPPVTLADKVVRYANENKIRIIIDILDLWPEAFNMVLPFHKLTHYLLEPMRRKVNRVYAGADEIVAVSETYVKRAMQYNKKCKKGLPVYIGTDLEEFDKYSKKQNTVIDNEKIQIAYIGTLGTSYNLPCIMDAINKVDENVKKEITFIIMGDGPQRDAFENHARALGIDVKFTGKLPYKEMVAELCKCDIAVNPIRSASAASIINKVADYAAAGIPVINTQASKEYRDLLEEYNAGFNFDEADTIGMAHAITDLANTPELRRLMGANSRRLFEERFNRNKSYPLIVEKIGGGITLVYIGMLGHSYDLRCAIDAIKSLKDIGYDNLKLVVMGDGPLGAAFESYAEEKNIQYEFTGRLSYGGMVSRLTECDIALNVLSPGAPQSIINKHADYLSAGLPILNNQEVAEFGELLEHYHCGINCNNNDWRDLAAAMKILCDDIYLRVYMGKNSRNMAENLFDRRKSYKNIINKIKGE